MSKYQLPGQRTGQGDSILEALDRALVVRVERQGDQFTICERYSDFYWCGLTREQLIALADELRALADQQA